MPGIALAAGAAAQLAVDAAALVALGAEDVEPARELLLAARHVLPDAVLEAGSSGPANQPRSQRMTPARA